MRVRGLCLRLAVLLLAAGCGARDGLNQVQSGGYNPPDNNVSVGAGWVVEATNVMVRMTKGQDIRYVSPSSLTGCTNLLGDPHIDYDFTTGRWFFVVLGGPPGGTSDYWCMAVSTSSDPTSTWYQYQFKPGLAWFGSSWGNQQPFPDYPSVGITPDKIVLTGNLFHLFIGIAKVKNSGVMVINKSNLVNGQPAAAQYFAPPKLAADGIPGPTFFLHACHQHFYGSTDGTTWLAGVNAYGEPAERLALYSIAGVPPWSAIYGPQFYDFPDGRKFRVPPRAKQKGTDFRVETNDHRVLDVQCLGNRMVVAAHHGCTPPNDDLKRTCLRYLDFTYTGAGWALVRDTRYREKGRYFYYPSIALNVYGEVISTFNKSAASTSSAPEFVSVYASGMRSYYGNDVFAPPKLLKAGLSSWFLDRWGDYSGTALDPNLTSGSAHAYGAYPIAGGTWGTWYSPLPRQNFPQ